MVQVAPKGKKKSPKSPSTGLGATKEDDVKLAPQGASNCPACPEADRALLNAILFAYEPGPDDIRTLAIEDLGLLGDARVLNVLAGLILDPNAKVGLAALHAVRAFQTPRAEEILENVVRHPRLSDVAKSQALDALPFQRSRTAREFLESVSRDAEGRYGTKLANLAKSALARWGDGKPSPASK